VGQGAILSHVFSKPGIPDARIIESRKMVGRKMAIQARWPIFFCPASFCWDVPGFGKVDWYSNAKVELVQVHSDCYFGRD
jgi:hypothetical protein